MSDVDQHRPGSLLDYLPEIYREQEHPFLSRYLSAFEKMLIGRHDGVEIKDGTDGASARSFEETISGIATLFDPRVTPKDFLPWLASWAALSLRADLDEGQQRNFIAKIIQLYRRRGTKGNLIELLKLFTGTTPVIDEDATPGESFRKRYSYSNTEHFFKVSVWLGRSPDPATVVRQEAIARALIELEKPAHTFYELEIRFTSMKIGNFSDRDNLRFRAHLGDNTLINVHIDPEDLKTDKENSHG